MFLSFPLNVVPSSLASADGVLARTNKAMLLDYIESECPSSNVDQIPDNSALVIDGMAIVHVCFAETTSSHISRTGRVCSRSFYDTYKETEVYLRRFCL